MSEPPEDPEAAEEEVTARDAARGMGPRVGEVPLNYVPTRADRGLDDDHNIPVDKAP